MRDKKPTRSSETRAVIADYEGLVSKLVAVLSESRRASAHTVNSIMTTAYWEVGRRIVEYEQGGKMRAGYGDELTRRLARDLTDRFGKRLFRQESRADETFLQDLADFADTVCGIRLGQQRDGTIWQTLSAKSRCGFDGSGPSMGIRWWRLMVALAFHACERRFKTPPLWR
jgi:hypothetical protein